VADGRHRRGDGPQRQDVAQSRRAIRHGRRGLTGGSLSKLLDEHVGPRPVAGRDALTAELILAWADRHK
jgi:hypothetical protein